MKYVLAGMAVVVLAGLGMYLRATWASEVAVQIGPSTTVVSEPRNAQGMIDYDGAMQASAASEQRLQSLFEVLVTERNSTAECTPLEGETRARVLELAREPLRMRRPASHVTEASQQLATRLLFVLRRVSCSCSKQPATAADSAQMLTSLSAYLSSSNQDTFYQLHSLAARAATECMRASNTPSNTAGLHFFDAIEHLELVRLSMLEEIVGRPDLDLSAALTAFNDDFMRALDGAHLPPPVEPTFSWLRTADANRADKSAFIGRSYAQQVPEIVTATRVAAENTANERRAWAGE